VLCARQWPAFDPELRRTCGRRPRHQRLYDLRPLVDVDCLKSTCVSTPRRAQALAGLFSPATPRPGDDCVGGDESSEFLRQSALLGSAGERQRHPDADRHHFSVVDDLAVAESALSGASQLMNWINERILQTGRFVDSAHRGGDFRPQHTKSADARERRSRCTTRCHTVRSTRPDFMADRPTAPRPASQISAGGIEGALLAAAARAAGIPARVGFADVKNHLTTAGAHGEDGHRFFATTATELYLDGKWVKATPAFTSACARACVSRSSSTAVTTDLPPVDEDERRHMSTCAGRGELRRRARG